VDAVIISTPHHLHAPQAIRAIDAGKHVLVEKPLATTLKDAVSIVQAARKAGVQLSIIFPYRYMSRILKAKALIEAGALGELFGVSLTFHDDKFASYWQGGHTGRSVSDWRQRWETSGGGFVIATVIHHIDWLRYLPGLDIVEVSAKYTTWDSPGEVEDTLMMWFRYENGALGTINASSCVRGTDLVEFRFWGRDGQISLAQPYQFYSLKRVDGKRPGLWHEFSDFRGISQRDVEYLQRFSDHVLRGEGPEITGEDGLAVQAIIEAAYESSRTGQVLKVERGPW
jgi:predicted dehydrogenase